MSESQMSRLLAEKWKGFYPPVRPSPKFLQVYEEHIRKIENRRDPKVLILGATPELRMMALKHNARVTAVDFSEIVINAMKEFMDYTKVNKNNETIVNCDWLNIPQEIGSYDLILGDGSINELKFEDYENLLIKLRHLIKNDGFVSTKIQLAYPDEREPMAMIDVLEEYKKKPEEMKTNLFSDLLMRLYYTSEAYDIRSCEWSSKKALRGLKRLLHQRKIEKREFEVLIDFFGFLVKWDYRATLPNRSALERMLSNHFSIISSTHDEEGWFLDTRVYLLAPKR